MRVQLEEDERSGKIGVTGAKGDGILGREEYVVNVCGSNTMS
jgi:hypothetical protein